MTASAFSDFDIERVRAASHDGAVRAGYASPSIELTSLPDGVHILISESRRKRAVRLGFTGCGVLSAVPQSKLVDWIAWALQGGLSEIELNLAALLEEWLEEGD
jgi:hypothetical protein